MVNVVDRMSFQRIPRVGRAIVSGVAGVVLVALASLLALPSQAILGEPIVFPTVEPCQDEVLFDGFEAPTIPEGRVSIGNAQLPAWDVRHGSIDILSPNYYSFPYDSQYVDLDGSAIAAATMETKTKLALAPGATVTVQWRERGNPVSNPTNSMTVSLGEWSASVSLAKGVGWREQSHTFTVSSTYNASLKVVHEGADFGGIFFDNVRVCITPHTPPLDCLPASVTLRPGEYHTWEANGGRTGNDHAWTAEHGVPASGQSSRFQARFTDPGDYRVQVRSGAQEAECQVHVAQPPVLWTVFDMQPGLPYPEPEYLFPARGDSAPRPQMHVPAPTCNGLKVEFDASASSDSDGAVTELIWDFGDGTGATGRIVSHEFPRPGRFVVTLRVHDDRGFASETQKAVLLGDCPELHIVAPGGDAPPGNLLRVCAVAQGGQGDYRRETERLSDAPLDAQASCLAGIPSESHLGIHCGVIRVTDGTDSAAKCIPLPAAAATPSGQAVRPAIAPPRIATSTELASTPASPATRTTALGAEANPWPLVPPLLLLGCIRLGLVARRHLTASK